MTANYARPFPQNDPEWLSSLPTSRGVHENGPLQKKKKLSTICISAEAFSKALWRVFDHRTPGKKAAQGLLVLRQGNSRVADYATHFCTRRRPE